MTLHLSSIQSRRHCVENSPIALPKDIQLIATADATNLATAITLVNSIKSTANKLILSYNELINETRKSGVGK